MRRILRITAALGILGAAAFWLLTRAQPLPAELLAGLSGDAARGEAVFWAGGCASCHATPGSKSTAQLVLTGGAALVSPFGTFYAPNISPDPDHGIGGWSLNDLASALIRGVSPDGTHYYPAFPYTSYTKMTLQDVADLWMFLQTLPPDATPNQPHQLAFPFTIRRGLGLWKQLYLTDGWVADGPLDPAKTRGRYLVEALGHCGECHTPRNLIGGLKLTRWLSGAPHPSGRGKIPALTPDRLTWNAADIAYYLETGFTPDFDSAGGEMAEVVSNMARLTPDDRAAIAAYLKALPPAD